VRVLNSPMTYPEALAELWMGDRHEGLDELRDYYLAGVRRLGILQDGARWFTDKMPLNEMHLGLIALMFPRAPLIHVLRHPLDIVLSVFSNHLTHGFYCSYALESAARHYALVMELVEHYRGQMTLHYLPVRYEDLVDDLEGSTRRMLDFIGEEFDESCVRFHENRRYARTASYAQVTEPLYDRSRYRYRHYLKQLEGVLPILAPTIERLGYPVG
jgi:Sulfotransferase family